MSPSARETGGVTRCRIVPPHLLEAIARYGDEPARLAALATLGLDTSLRLERALRPGPGSRTAEAVPAGPQRSIADAAGLEQLPGTVVRREGEPDTGDPAVDEAYAGLGSTYALLAEVYGRDSIDGAGMALRASVHYGRDYDNAFWNGERMVFGDGDGQVFRRFTVAVDVIGHELAHGVTEATAALAYRGQPGALNESMSDVVGSLVKQYALRQTAAEADWLIGAGLFEPSVRGVALRSMAAPGTAYDDPVLGRDPQPATMAGYVDTARDNGGVHVNSGIPNHAFYLAATAIGGPAWESAGRIWYDALVDPQLRPDTDFAGFAALTVTVAGRLAGEGSGETDAVRTAWQQVGVLPG